MRNRIPWNKSSVEQEKGYHCDGRSENGETSTWKQQAMGTMISDGKRTTLGRRAFLWRILAGTAGVAIGTLMSSCSNASSRRLDEEPKPAPAQPTSTGSKVFSEPDHTPTLATSTGSRSCWPTSRGLGRTTTMARQHTSMWGTPRFWRA